MSAYSDYLRPWCQDGLWLDTLASTGDIFAFTLGEEFSNWTDRAGAVREALPLPGDPSCVAIREGADHCSACRDNLAQLLSFQQDTFHCTSSRGDRG